MRKIYIVILSLLSIIVFNSSLNAQAVGTYVFAPSSGTYAALTGATVSTAAGDDGVQNVPIGFNFVFGGVTYTNAVISTNGAIKLATDGTTGFAASWTNNLSNTYGAPIIGPSWDDNNSTGGSVVYLTTGPVGTRTFSVEWINIHMGGGGSTATPTGTFQLTLTESTNFITFVYGTINTLTSSTISIGLNDLTSFLSVTPGTPATASSTTANNGISSAALTPSGTTYTFFPPPPCVPGSLSGGTTTGVSGPVCPGGSFTLSVTSASFGTGLSYSWESSPDNVSWNPVVPAATGQTLTTSITVSTYFRRKITCSTTSTYSTSLLVSVSASATVPFTETFAGYTTLFPPACWSQTNNLTLLGGPALSGVAPSAYGIGTGSARFEFFWIGSGVNTDLATTVFSPVPANYRLTFDHAYETFTTEVDQLQILYSTNGGATYSNLATYLGGPAGPLNTVGGSGASTAELFTPTAAQWATKVVALPVGTNKLIFRGVSGFGNNLFLDNITVEPVPSCLPPSGLTVTAIAPTTATLSWTAAVPAPSNGYQYEVRTSGAAGSGATGLAASGTTAAGVTTANVTGLTPNTTYTYYVRSDCGGSSFSSWALPYIFTTPCNAIGIPYTETFASYATTFPPTCWTRNNTTFLIGNAASGNAVGLGSAEFDFYDASAGTSLDLVSPLFTPVPTNYRLTFDHAYATFIGEVDQLQIYYSTDGGATYSNLITYLGGSAGPLNTAGGVIPPFTPTSASQWANKAVNLPIGTNRLRFRGVSAFGNNLYLDNITVEPVPSCLPVSGVTAVAISPTSAVVSFTPPATTPTAAYIVEWGLAGFTPGTTNVPGVGGQVVFGPGSPITVIGLTASTNYDFYVRKMCIAGVDFSINRKASATTLCPAVNIPYLQNFESAVVPAMPTCTSKQDVNGNSGSFWLGTGGGQWETYTDANPLTYVSPSKALLYYYDFNNLSRGGDDWFYIQGLNLTAGTSYRLKFFYKAIDGVNYPEKMEVKYGKYAYADSMTAGTLFTNNNISSVYGNPYDSVRVDFTPPSTGVFYVGFHATSLGDEFGILVDDISVKLAPLVDVGISGITLPSLNCPTNGVFVQATITNYNTTTQNFALYPVNVTATITGAGTGTLTALINAGTLAPGASMGIYLSPAFNFSTGGIYNITTATSTVTPGQDPETGNDAFTTSINVNPNPPTPVITPSNPAICAGNPVLLSTQFAPSPPPVIIPVTAGSLNVNIPDNTPAGITHTIPVSGIPAGATVTSVSVTIDSLLHTWDGDVIISLKAPNGKVLNLVNQEGGSGDNYISTVISPASTTSLSTGLAPFTGTFAADANVAAPPTGFDQTVTSFPGLYSIGNGNWTLAMRDNAGLDVGVLKRWTITITYQILTPVITWAPVGGLYTNAAATTAYPGGNAYSLYANPPATTTYVVTATTMAGCTSSASTTVTVNPYTPITLGSIPDTVCTSDQVIPLLVSPVGGTWTGIGVSGSNFIPPATAVGTYTLTYTYTNQFGCTTTATKKIAVKDCPERIIRLRDNAVILYPNPNNGQFNIRMNSVLYNNLGMKVFTNSGVLVRTQQLGGLYWGRVVPIDLTNLPGGVYMVKFYYDGGVRSSEKTFKVIIGHE